MNKLSALLNETFDGATVKNEAADFDSFLHELVTLGLMAGKTARIIKSTGKEPVSRDIETFTTELETLLAKARRLN